MNKRWAIVTIIILILIFVGYVVVDVALKSKAPSVIPQKQVATGISDQWFVEKIFKPGLGELASVAVSDNGSILLGGESFVACYDPQFNLLWEYKTQMPATALASAGNNVYAAVEATIQVLNMKGEKIGEWGPFEANSMITSLTSNELYVAFADAANKEVFILDKKGALKSLIGGTEEPFIIPSAYFDVALNSESVLFVANTGNRRIERRNIDGKLLSFFGQPGTDPGSFCGCCNPAHFALIPGGFVTAEKGLNRIKILDNKGDFVEFVSSVNNFVPPLPLDLASPDGSVIYGANPADSQVYVFKRK